MDEVHTTNGSSPPMTQVVDVLRDAVAAHAARADQLTEELGAVKRELSNYRKALELIDGTHGAQRAKPGPKPKSQQTGTKIGPERLATIERAVRAYVDEHGDVEFRQLDIREYMDNTITSGVSSFAFKELRDANVLRVARKDGNNQYYRLTRQALAEA